ncbi:MAG TPA: TolC family protein [Gemmatimonadales bacterium]|nr:TolC family protein [Gemmatimonadales bacterium]
MHARSLLLSLSLVAAPVAAQGVDTTITRTLGAAPERISLAEALARAPRVQPTTVQAAGTVRNADAQRRSATGAFLPNVSGSAGGARSFSEFASQLPNGEIGTAGTTNQTVNMGLSASLDLFTGFRRGADIKAADAQQRSAEAGLDNARFQVALQTTQAFLDALATRQTVEVRIASVRRAQEQLKVSVAKLRAGSATRSDSLRSEVNLGNARIQLINAEIQQATAEANLGRLVGATGRVEAVDDSAYYRHAAIDTTGLRAEARAGAPQVRSSQASADAARAQIGATRAQYFPSLALTGNQSWSGNKNSDYQLFQNRSLSLGLSWTLFNRFARERNLVTSQVAADNAEATAADAMRQVDAGITQRFAELAAAQVRIGITQASVQAATEDLRVVGERYRLGAATIVDLLTSQEALTQAEVDAVNARFDYLRAKAQVEALIGRSL